MRDKHESQRGYFAHELQKIMGNDDNVWLLTGDLGWGMWDNIRDNFPNRFINCGASEQAMMSMAVGLAYEGKIPFVYSITPFLIYRSFETIRTYIDHEDLPVKMIGSGRNDDYKHDGYSHFAGDDIKFMGQFDNIDSYYPIGKSDIDQELLQEVTYNNKPCYVNLHR